MYLKKIVTTLIINKKMKRTIVLQYVYFDITYAEYLHVGNQYYKNPWSFKCFKIIVF